MEVEDVTILTGWAESIAEALVYVPERVPSLLVEAADGARWRDGFQLAAPTPRLVQALEFYGELLTPDASGDRPRSFDEILAVTQANRDDEVPLNRLARRVLRSTLEQLRTRQGDRE